MSEEEVSLFHSLFFVGEEKSRKIESAKKPPYSSSQSAKAHSQSHDVKRRRRCSFCAHNTLFFSPFACRPLRRPPSFCARKHRMMMMMMMMPMSLSRRGFQCALFIQTTTLGTREDDDEGEAFHAKTRAQKRRRRRRRKQPHLISGLRSHSRSRERRGR